MAIVSTGTIKSLPLVIRPMTEASQALSDLKDGKVIGRIVLQAEPASSL